MAKAPTSNSTRIPRLDNVSRIPLPGSIIRSPKCTSSVKSRIGMISQSAVPLTSTVGSHPLLTTTAKTGIVVPSKTAPTLRQTRGVGISKSQSGDRINNTFIKKPLTKNMHSKVMDPIMQIKAVDVQPPSLTRSDTFIRESLDGNRGIMATMDALAHSTPAPSILRPISTLENGNTTVTLKRHGPSPVCIYDSDNTRTMYNYGTTISKDNLMPTNDMTFSENTPKGLRSIHVSVIDGKQLQESLKGAIGETMPPSNVTYSKAGSTDNMLMLEDVGIPADFELDATMTDVTAELETTLNNCVKQQQQQQLQRENQEQDRLVPDKAGMKLQLHSTLNKSHLIDVSPLGNMRNNFDFSRELRMLDSPGDCGESQEEPIIADRKNDSKLLYMTQVSLSASTTPDRQPISKMTMKGAGGGGNPHMSPLALMKGAKSDIVLPTRTPDYDGALQCGGESLLDMEATLKAMCERTEEFFAHQQLQHGVDLERTGVSGGVAVSLQDVRNTKQKSRFSFGLDLTESTLDCSIELVDVSLSSTAISQANVSSLLLSNQNLLSDSHHQQQLLLRKQNSFDMDESLGILTPEQMKEFLDSPHMNAAVNTSAGILDLPLLAVHKKKMALHQMRMDQTPSPEELPLDTIAVKTDTTGDDFVSLIDAEAQQRQQQQQQLHATEGHSGDGAQPSLASLRQQHLQQQHLLQSSSLSTAEPVSQQTDSGGDLSKADPMVKSTNVSKISTSFITSVTSVTSLDTGYQGDGEMSRPASRGASDHSPSNGPLSRKPTGGHGHVSRQPSFNQQQQQPPPHLPPIRRQDPMTDSDFFTESDADDIFHRGGDRRAQVIDGQLYGPGMLQQPSSASVFITEDPQMEDSCMESSGIFTDIENRCDEDPSQMRYRADEVMMQPPPPPPQLPPPPQSLSSLCDVSPDGDADNSTETVRKAVGGAKRLRQHSESLSATAAAAAAANLSPSAVDGNMATSCGDGSGQQQQQFGQGQLSNSQTSSTIQSSCSNDRLSAATTLSNRTSYCSVDGGSATNVYAVLDSKSFTGSLEERAFVERYDRDGNTVDRVRVYDDVNDDNVNVNVDADGTLKSSSNSSGVAHESPTEQSSAVLRVNSPRKHASLTSLSQQKQQYLNINKNNNNSLVGKKTATINVNRPPNQSQGTSINQHKVSRIDREAKSCVSGAGSSDSLKSISSTGCNSPRSIDLKVQSANSLGNSVRKSHHAQPNKWDAVMNKIASNRALIKKNYNDVKSKVSTRINMVVQSAANGGGASPSSMADKTSNGVHQVVARKATATHATIAKPMDKGSTATTKRTLSSGVVQRGRLYSKDSQKSSQSDLSAGGSGSPKVLLAKTPLRAAKKRDVRNLSISPTDLGPPPKAQQTVNNSSSARLNNKVNGSIANGVLLAQKRSNGSTPNTTAASTPTSGGSLKGSPLAKKNNLIISKSCTNANKRVEGKSPVIVTLKEHSRLIPTSRPGTTAVVSNAVTPTLPATPKSVEAEQEPITDICDDQQQDSFVIISATNYPNNINNNNNNNDNNSNDIHRNDNSLPVIASELAGNGQPISMGNGHAHRASSPASPVISTRAAKSTANGSAVNLPEKKTARKLLLQKTSHQRSADGVLKNAINSNNTSPKGSPKAQRTNGGSTASSREGTPPSRSVADPLTAEELQQLKLLKRHSCNGRLDYKALDMHLQATELAQQHMEKTVQALGVLLQYAVHELDAFACPAAKHESAKALENLEGTRHLLNETKSTCAELQDQLCEKQAYYAQREDELQVLHRCESEKAQSSLAELQQIYKEQQCSLEAQLATKEAEHLRQFTVYRTEVEEKMRHKDEQIKLADERATELQARLSASETKQEKLKDLIEQAAVTNSEREKELKERLNSLSTELETLRTINKDSERELRDQLNWSQDEISILRRTDSINSTAQLTDRSSTASMSELSRLQSEAESLRCVLELKQKEISKLSKHNEELMRDADERSALQGKISTLESHNEMLVSELQIKSDREKNLQLQMDTMQKNYSHDQTKIRRLFYDKEELQWQLKQRSEQLHIVEGKLAELSGQDTNLFISSNQLQSSSFNNRTSQQQLNNGFHMDADTGSPQLSPIIKGVIEKNESVSWVLEMDDETPEVAASKMVKRAGSFRSMERSPSMRRQLSMSGGVACDSASPGFAYELNPLSQSMSATAVVRQHSNDAVGLENSITRTQQTRLRSKSVSVRIDEAPTSSAGPKRILRPQSQSPSSFAPGGRNNKNELIAGNWEPFYTSSPNTNVNRTSGFTVKAQNGINDCERQSGGSDDDARIIFRRNSTQKLITCDTSALDTGERLEIHSLPSTHPSVHDLKKKCHEIQESAGEAMVSGTNSEDEGCSASSDEVITSATTSSASPTSCSTSSLNQHHLIQEDKNEHMQMSLEQVLLLDKSQGSLSGTPMEVSWSEDTQLV